MRLILSCILIENNARDTRDLHRRDLFIRTETACDSYIVSLLQNLLVLDFYFDSFCFSDFARLSRREEEKQFQIMILSFYIKFLSLFPSLLHFLSLFADSKPL